MFLECPSGQMMDLPFHMCILCFYCQLTLRKPVLFWPFGVGVTRPTEPKDNTLHRTVILLLML